MWTCYCPGWWHQELHLLPWLPQGISWTPYWVLCCWTKYGGRGHGVRCTRACHHFHQHLCRILYSYFWPSKNGCCVSDLCQLLWISLWCVYWWVVIFRLNSLRYSTLKHIVFPRRYITIHLRKCNVTMVYLSTIVFRVQLWPFPTTHYSLEWSRYLFGGRG